MGIYKNAEDIQKRCYRATWWKWIVKIKDAAKVPDTAEERFREVGFEFDRENISSFQNAVFYHLPKRKGTMSLYFSATYSRVNSFSKTLPKEIKGSLFEIMVLIAADKTKELIEHLLLATLSVSVLIAIFMGIRASFVIAVAIPVTLALTLAVYYF